MYDFIHAKYVWCALTCELCACLLFYCLADSVEKKKGILKKSSMGNTLTSTIVLVSFYFKHLLNLNIYKSMN